MSRGISICPPLYSHFFFPPSSKSLCLKIDEETGILFRFVFIAIGVYLHWKKKTEKRQKKKEKKKTWQVRQRLIKRRWTVGKRNRWTNGNLRAPSIPLRRQSCRESGSVSNTQSRQAIVVMAAPVPFITPQPLFQCPLWHFACCRTAVACIDGKPDRVHRQATAAISLRWFGFMGQRGDK